MKIDSLSKDALSRVLNEEPVWPPPVWLMRQAGRYLPEYRALRAKAGSFWALCNSPQLAAEVTLQPVRRFDLDAAIVFSDILTVPAALGQQVRMEEGVGPQLADFPGVDRLERDAAKQAALLRPVYETLSQVRSELTREKALIGFAGAPWTLATYMLGNNGSPEERVARARAGESLVDLLDVLAETTAHHLAAQLNAGADVVQVFDSWAGGLNDKEFADWIVTPTKSLIDRLRQDVPSARVIGFPRGAMNAQYQSYAKNTGVDAVSIHTDASMAWAADALGKTVAVQGNLDPLILVQGGDALNRAVDDILEAAHGAPFIFNLGHGVVPETPPEHVEALVRRVRAWRR